YFTHMQLYLFLFSFTLLSPPLSTLFPYTTLFRSVLGPRRVGFQLLPQRGHVYVDRARDRHRFVAPHLLQQLVAREQRAAVLDERSEEHTSNSSHDQISYAVFCLKKKKKNIDMKSE